MTIRTAAFSLLTAALLGCSTPQPERIAYLPPPDITVDLPPEPPRTPHGGYVCKLGDSCLAMDPRPFEMCLVGTKRCLDKAQEPVEVHGPPPAKPADDVIQVWRAE